MSSFDDLLRQGAPEPEVNIYLPGKVGTVDKGGDAAQAAATPAGRASDTQASSTAPEPEPQLPEGSDPDEPDTSEDDAADAAEAAAAAREMFKVEPEPDPEPLADSAEDPATPAVDEAVAVDTEEVNAHPVIPRKGGGLTFEGPSVNLKYFPRVLVEGMREMLNPRLGEDFARDLSQFSLVTAFVIAAMGVELTTDEYTAAAVRAFKEADPRTDAIEKRTATLLEQQTRFEGMMKALLARVGEVTEATAVLEIGQAYALAERTAQLDSETASAPPERLDVTQKRVIATRDNIRRRVKLQRQDEKIRSGRPIR
ncbi:hypothetical protein WMO79_01280 [Micrococcaceae bacterium Sec7.4]